MKKLVLLSERDTGRFHNAWIVDGDVATSYHNQSMKVPLNGSTLIEALAKHEGPFQLASENFTASESKLERGEYHPRICWSVLHHSHMLPPADEKVIHSASRQLQLLVGMLDSTFSIVEPEVCHLEVYGPQYRNLLMLGATEFETQCRGVLQANGCEGNKRLNTRDFIKLRDLMFLNEYSLRFTSCPWLSLFKPFDGWHAEKPTQSLPWYDAYNEIKHHREENEAKAQLQYAMQSIAAVCILLVAQYGWDRRGLSWMREKFNLFLPSTFDIERVYFAGKWKERTLDFERFTVE